MTPGRPPPRRAAQWAAIGLFVALPIAAMGLGAFNFARAVDLDAAAILQEAQIAEFDQRMTRLRAGQGALRDVSAIYLDGASRPLAGAALQQRLADMIAVSGGRLIETQPEDEARLDEAADPGEIRLRVTLDARNDGLRRLLYDLEMGVPLLHVETIGIRQLPAASGSGDDDPLLRVDLMVRGHWRPDIG